MDNLWIMEFVMIQWDFIVIQWDIIGLYPLVMANISIENGPVEIVSFTINNGDFP